MDKVPSSLWAISRGDPQAPHRSPEGIAVARAPQSRHSVVKAPPPVAIAKRRPAHRWSRHGPEGGAASPRDPKRYTGTRNGALARKASKSRTDRRRGRLHRDRSG